MLTKKLYKEGRQCSPKKTIYCLPSLYIVFFGQHCLPSLYIVFYWSTMYPLLIVFFCQHCLLIQFRGDNVDQKKTIYKEGRQC
jgi:hypothetical protein